MEEAIFITEASSLKNWSGRYSRIYFGSEFCQRLIPTIEEVEEILNFTLSKDLRFTFVTSFVTDTALDSLQDLLNIISRKTPNSEVVINDWGMLGIVKKHHLIPVIGRLLTKQRRDPRILNMRKNLTEEAVERSRTAGIGLHLIRFLKNNNVERMEIDNLPQGIKLREYINLERFHFSLYFPYNYVTTSRRCIFNDSCHQLKGNDLSKCERRCRRSSVVLRHDAMPLPLYLKGSTIFLENRKLPDSIAQEGIDRIIYQPDIPI